MSNQSAYADMRALRKRFFLFHPYCLPTGGCHHDRFFGTRGFLIAGCASAQTSSLVRA